MIVGDAQYQTALAKWRALYTVKLANRLTFRQAVQLDSLDKQLTAAEAQHGIATVVDDYDQMRQMGDLGGCEIL